MMNFKKFAKAICLTLAVMLCMVSTVFAANVSDFVDFPQDWSTPAMEYAVDNGLIKGYEDSTIRPNKNITRAEMGTIVNRAFGAFVEAVNFPYLDVDDEDWFYSDMKKAVNMGTMQGSDNLLRPNDSITREEAFVVIARAYSIKNSDHAILEQFDDVEDISQWAKDYLSFLTENDYVNGFDDGNLYPKKNLTRAELSQILYNMLNEYVGSQSELDSKSVYEGNIVINGEITNITGKTFKGDLVIGDGVGTSEIIIKDTVIEGRLIVRGATKIKIVNSSIKHNVVVNNPNGNVHFDNFKSEVHFDDVETMTSATWNKGTGSSSGSSGGGHHGGFVYYTVNFYKNDNTVDLYDTISAVSGRTVAAPETNPTRTGYTFAGWYTSSDCTTPYDFTQPVRSDLNLYAKWDINTYTVTFKNFDGTVLDTQTVNHGATAVYGGATPVKPADNTYTYEFSGWDKELTNITENTEFTAQFTPKYIDYIVKFVADGVEIGSFTKHYGDVITVAEFPAVPSKEGYTGVWSITTDITVGDSVEVVAIYTINTYTVTFKNYDGTVLDTQTVNHGDTVVYGGTMPAKAADNTYTYEFAGWDKALTNITETTEFTAQFTPKYIDYIVKFVADGVEIGSFTKHYGDVITVADFPAVPSKEGYTGVWSITTDITVGDSVEVVAIYTINTYTVTFKNYDGTVLDTQTVNHGDTVVYGGTMPAKSADNTYTYEFAGWDKALTNITETTEFTAQFTPKYIDYIVKFVADGVEIGSFTKHYGDVITVAEFPAVPSKEGYTGVWSITTDITVGDSVEVVAIYTINTYTVTFKNYDGTVLDTQTVNHGDTVVYGGTMPAKAADNTYTYEFAGWDKALTNITETTEFTAQFTPKYIDYIVKFVADGVEIGSFTKHYGDVITVAEFPAVPSKEGYTGVWSITTDITVGDSVEVVAIYTINTYTVTFKNYDGTVLDTQTVNHGATAVYGGATPVKPADNTYTYEFAGWDKALTNITETTEFTAQFTPKYIDYTVKFVADGVEIGSFTKHYGDVISATEFPALPTEPGYTISWGVDSITVAGETTITATKTINKYTIIYHNDDNTVVGQEEYDYNEAVTLISVTKTGYNFAGWFYDNDVNVDDGDPTTDIINVYPNVVNETGGVINIYAKWTPITYKVKFIDNKFGNEAYEQTFTYDIEVALMPTQFVGTGWNVTKWIAADGTTEYEPEALVKNLASTDGAVVELTTYWMPINFTVVYTGGTGATGSTAESYHTYDVAKNLTTNGFEKEGYTFIGWKMVNIENPTTYSMGRLFMAAPQVGDILDNEQLVKNLTDINGARVILEAIWEANTYYVQYNKNDASAEGTMANSEHTYDTKSPLASNSFTLTGYTFGGWAKTEDGAAEYENNQEVLNLTAVKDGVVNLYATWVENNYTVKFDGNGATSGTMTDMPFKYTEEKALNKNTFERTGYTFKGWKTANGEELNDEAIVSKLTAVNEGIVTLYADWEPNVYKLTFDVTADGKPLTLTPELESLGYYVDTETGKITIKVTYDAAYPQLPKAEYKDSAMSFAGWLLNGTPVPDVVKITADTTLVASWTDKHIVIFHGYYEDDEDSLTVYVEDGEAVEKPADPSHSSFTFGGWYTDEACTDGNEYDFAATINKVNDEFQTIHLYPRWYINVRFFYGPEALADELQAEVTVQYNTVIDEADIPADRITYGYWKDGEISDVYVGEEYEHTIEFKWHKAVGDSFEEFDLTQPIVESLDLFNVARNVDISISSSKDAIDGAVINAIYTSDEPLYENILDVIFEHENLANTVYGKIDEKEKVFNKLMSLGIIDENMNILNQAKFLKFSLIGKERLETFVYENVEKELTVDAKESITAYLNNLIEKNDGSAESFLRELIDTLLNGEGKKEMESVLKEMLTEMVELEKDEFVKYINEYIDESIAKGDTSSVENLIAPQIERLLTETIAKDFVRSMSKDQLTNFVNIYIDTLSEDELKKEVNVYINGLSETEIKAEVYGYVNGLTDAEVEAEIKKYIEGLSDTQLEEEILAYVNGLGVNELKDAIVEHINTLEDEDLEKEIKDYFLGLSDADKKAKITEYFEELTDAEIKGEVVTYIKELSDEDLEKEISDYIAGLTEGEKKAEVRKYIDGLSDTELEAEIKKYINGLSDGDLKAEIKKYINGLSDGDLKAEIKKYINGFSDTELEAEIKKYINGLSDTDLIAEIGKYIDGLSDADLEAEIKKYINGLSDTDLTTEIGKYIDGLSDADLEAEIKKYIDGLSDADLKAEIKKYIDGLNDADLTTEIGKYIDGLDDTQKTAEIKKYINELEDTEKEDEVTSYVENLADDDFKNEIKGYINGLNDSTLKAEIETYLTENDDECKNLIKEYIKETEGIDIPDTDISDDIKAEYFDEVVEYAISTEKKDETVENAAKYITENKRFDYEAKIINQVTDNFANYIDEIVEKAMTSTDLNDYIAKAAEKVVSSAEKDSYIDSAVEKIVNGAEKDSYIDSAVEKIVNGADRESYIGKAAEKVVSSAEKDSYIDSAVEKIVNGADRDSYIESAASKIINSAEKDSYINSAVEKIVTGADRDSYINSAVDKIVNGAEKDSYINSAVDKIVNGAEKDNYINSAVEKIVKGTDRDSYINSAVDKIVADGKLETYIPSVVEKIVNGGDLDSYVGSAVDKIIAKGELDGYIDRTIDTIIKGSKLETYIAKAVENIMASSKKQQYIEETALAIAKGSNRDTYVKKAAETIVKNPTLKDEYTQKAIDKIVGSEDEAKYVEKAVEKILASADRDKYINDTINKIFADGKYQQYIDKAVAKIVDKTPADYSDIDKHIENMFATAEKKQQLVDYINDQFIENADFRTAVLPDAIDMIFHDEESKTEVINTIVDYVINDEDALKEMTDIAIKDLVKDADFREKTIDRIAHYLEDHPEIMDKVVEFAKETELGVFVDKFIDELMTEDKFEVSEDNLFVAEAIERALAKYDYDSFMNTYIPERFAGLIPDSVIKPIYEESFNGFSSQLTDAIALAKEGRVGYVDTGVTVKFNPIVDFVIPVFNKYLEFKDKAEDKLEGTDNILADIYNNVYGENKYLKELVDILSIENFLNGNKSLATETLSGYSLREFTDYYEIFRNASVLLIDNNKWCIDNLPEEKGNKAQEKLAQKITEYYNSLLALVNDYNDTGVLPSYKDVLEIFEGDIPDRFFAKYESALSKIEANINIDDKADAVYDKLAQKGIVSKFDTILDRFVASKFNREITEEQVPLVYSIIRKAHGYDDFYTVDTVFNGMSKVLERFKVNEDKYVIGNSKLEITIERSFR